MSHTSQHISKLNIASLKQLAKQLQLTGYSKLNKGPLIDKILAAQPAVAATETDPQQPCTFRLSSQPEPTAPPPPYSSALAVKKKEKSSGPAEPEFASLIAAVREEPLPNATNAEISSSLSRKLEPDQVRTGNGAGVGISSGSFLLPSLNCIEVHTSSQTKLQQRQHASLLPPPSNSNRDLGNENIIDAASEKAGEESMSSKTTKRPPASTEHPRSHAPSEMSDAMFMLIKKKTKTLATDKGKEVQERKSTQNVGSRLLPHSKHGLFEGGDGDQNNSMDFMNDPIKSPQDQQGRETMCAKATVEEDAVDGEGSSSRGFTVSSSPSKKKKSIGNKDTQTSDNIEESSKKKKQVMFETDKGGDEPSNAAVWKTDPGATQKLKKSKIRPNGSAKEGIMRRDMSTTVKRKGFEGIASNPKEKKAKMGSPFKSLPASSLKSAIDQDTYMSPPSQEQPLAGPSSTRTVATTVTPVEGVPFMNPAVGSVSSSSIQAKSSSLTTAFALKPVQRPFKPLIPSSMLPPASQTPCLPKISSLPSSSVIAVPAGFSWLVHRTPLPAPKKIGFPPSLKERKKVPVLMILLQAVEREERGIVSMAGKSARQAMHLLAYKILKKYYSGQRLSSYIQQNAIDVHTNSLWAYLNLRRSEFTAHKHSITTSFLSKAYRFLTKSTRAVCGWIDECLYANPDDERQLKVCVRFLVGFVVGYFTLGGEGASKLGLMSPHFIVRDVKCVVAGIWCVSVEKVAEESNGKKVVMWKNWIVLEATGEPLGTAPPPSGLPLLSKHAPLQPQIPQELSLVEILSNLRQDWFSFITDRLFHSHSNGAASHFSFETNGAGLSTKRKHSILQLVETADCETYPCGVSAVFKKRCSEGDDGGEELLEVAERYILANCVMNSTSGEYQTVSQMESQWISNNATITAATNLKRSASSKPRINLFLPQSHHVESVHFTASKGSLLHPALAIVQRDHLGFDFVLRETCAVVGCEEGGVADAWMELLNCDKDGAVIAAN